MEHETVATLTAMAITALPMLTVFSDSLILKSVAFIWGVLGWSFLWIDFQVTHRV